METGTFEWALALMRSGYRMLRNIRDDCGNLHWRRVLFMGSETGKVFELWPSGFLREFQPIPDDISAKDWDLAK